jgi:hypothetical protein
VGLRRKNGAVPDPSTHGSRTRVQNWYMACSGARNQVEPALGQNVRVCVGPGPTPVN